MEVLVSDKVALLHRGAVPGEPKRTSGGDGVPGPDVWAACGCLRVGETTLQGVKWGKAPTLRAPAPWASVSLIANRRYAARRGLFRARALLMAFPFWWGQADAWERART